MEAGLITLSQTLSLSSSLENLENIIYQPTLDQHGRLPSPQLSVKKRPSTSSGLNEGQNLIKSSSLLQISTVMSTKFLHPSYISLHSENPTAILQFYHLLDFPGKTWLHTPIFIVAGGSRVLI